MRPGEHNGYGAGFPCPRTDANGRRVCSSIDAHVDYVTNDQNQLIGHLLTCVACGHEWVEVRASA